MVLKLIRSKFSLLAVLSIAFWAASLPSAFARGTINGFFQDGLPDPDDPFEGPTVPSPVPWGPDLWAPENAECRIWLGACYDACIDIYEPRTPGRDACVDACRAHVLYNCAIY